jgi:hypothetical protein
MRSTQSIRRRLNASDRKATAIGLLNSFSRFIDVIMSIFTISTGDVGSE